MKRFLTTAKLRCGAIGMLIVLFVGSCKKEGDAFSSPDASISFYNASEYLRAVLQNSARSHILIDSPGMVYQGTTYYSPGFSDNYYLLQFPNTYFNSSQSQPWVQYMRLQPGTHTIELTDTSGKNPLHATWAKLQTALPTSVYFTDSVGFFRSLILRDTLMRNDSAFQLRLITLSPDAGKVYFTINGQKATGFPDSAKYRQATNFLQWPGSTPKRLILKFYNTGDTSNVIAKSFVDAAPGHAYNLILKGYKGGRWMRDPYTGKFIIFNAGLSVAVTQNF